MEKKRQNLDCDRCRHSYHLSYIDTLAIWMNDDTDLPMPPPVKEHQIVKIY